MELHTSSAANVTRAELKRLLDEHSDVRFISEHLLTKRPWVFDSEDDYDEWRKILAGALAVPSQSILVVGSAATGYSLSPLKPGRPFRKVLKNPDQPSDIDVAVVDDRVFDEAWDTIVKFDRSGRLGIATEGRDKVRQGVYWGFISQLDVPRNTDIARRILSGMSSASRILPIRGHPVRSRIYRKRSDLEGYHISSLRRLRAELERNERPT